MRGKPIARLEQYPRIRITPAGAGKTCRSPRVFRSAWDHPRRCGENCQIVAQALEILGSPPQVRGKPTKEYSIQLQHRITPAGAGKTTVRYKSLLTGKGSPPQVRGKLSRTFQPAAKVRITPAGAGKTSCKVGRIADRKDHPRRCGENCVLRIVGCVATGSPPQVRGKRQIYAVKRYTVWITPAGAGKTLTQ